MAFTEHRTRRTGGGSGPHSAPLRTLGPLIAGLLVSEGTSTRDTWSSLPHLSLPPFEASEPGDTALLGEEMAWATAGPGCSPGHAPLPVWPRGGPPQPQRASESFPSKRQCGARLERLWGSPEEGAVLCSAGRRVSRAHPLRAQGKAPGKGAALRGAESERWPGQ